MTSIALLVQLTYFLGSVCVNGVTHHLLCFQVTPAPCRLSWSWRKLCVSMNSTKTLSSLSTVSLAPPHTQSIHITYTVSFLLFFIILSLSSLIMCQSEEEVGWFHTFYIYIYIFSSHFPAWTAKRCRRVHSCCWTGKLTGHRMEWGCTCMRSAECQEVRRLRGVCGCGWSFTLGCGQLSLRPLPDVGCY